MRIATLFRREHHNREIDAELRHHIDSHAEDLIRTGMPRAEALRQARIALGGLERAKEECRDAIGVSLIESFLQDLRFGLRMLRKNPGFTAIAVLTLALGIGANTAIFTLIDAVLLKSLPVKDPKSLVLLEWANPAGEGKVHLWMDGSGWDDHGRTVGTPFSYPIFEQIRARSQSLADIFALADLGATVNVVADGEPGLARGQLASSGIFTTLGLKPAEGRFFEESDDRPGAAPVCVISYGYWQSRFGGDAAIAGKSITVAGVPFTVIGVMPQGFSGMQAGTDVQLWVPITMQPLVEPDLDRKVSMFTAADHWWLIIVARLKPGVSPKQAASELNVIFKPLAEQAVDHEAGTAPVVPTLELTAGGEGLGGLRRQYSRPLFILFGLVGLVLLIACANVANLLLARATSRQREIGVRLSLGASRGRLARQLFTEGLLLAVMGGALGSLFAYWGSTVLVALLSPAGSGLALDASPDLRVLAFTACACLVTAILFGLAPAWHATRTDVTPVLKQGKQTFSVAGMRVGLGKILVIAQVSVSLVLLFGAGLFVRTLVNLREIDPGYDQSNVLVFGLNPTRAGYKEADLNNFFSRVQDRVATLPGVISATASYHLMLADGRRGNNVWVEGYARTDVQGEMNVAVMPAGPNFFSTMRIPLLRGRDIAKSDTEVSPKIAVVNEAFVNRFFAGRDPIGEHAGFGSDRSKPAMEIVGVVGNTKYASLREEDPPTLYHPYKQATNIPYMYFEVRTAMNPTALIPSLRAAVASVDRNVPLFDVATEKQQSDKVLLQERLFAKLTGFFGALALLLCCVGLYGILSYGVARRTSEIGIRMALGAQQRDVLTMILRETSLLIAAGIAIGVPVALGVARVASSVVSDLLYGVKTGDLPTIAIATALLMGVAVCAGTIPARRAARVDPMTALRHE
jgi:predicted permease